MLICSLGFFELPSQAYVWQADLQAPRRLRPEKCLPPASPMKGELMLGS